jgi:preprotein translocase subunit SecA
MNKQREIIYGRRLQSLEGVDLGEESKSLVGDIAAATVEEFTTKSDGDTADEWDFNGLRLQLGRRLGVDLDFAKLANEGNGPDALKEKAVNAVLEYYAERERTIGAELFRQFERFVHLRTIDAAWRDHLYDLDRLREGIGLRAYGQKDPLLEYKKEAFELFSSLMDRIDLEVAERLMKTEIRLEAPPAPSPQVLARARQAPAHAAATTLAGPGLPAGAARSASPLGRAPAAPAPRQTAPVTAGPRVGRNDPCPCGSGKKYKKCHGANG